MHGKNTQEKKALKKSALSIDSLAFAILTPASNRPKMQFSWAALNMHMKKNIENCCTPKTRKINGMDAMYVVGHWDVDEEKERKRKPIAQNQWKSWERNHDINKFQIKVI